MKFVVLFVAWVAWLGESRGQVPQDSALTNPPLPYSSTVLTPQPFIPQVFTPQTLTPQVHPATNTLPPVNRFSRPFTAPLPPTASELGKRLVPPPKPPPLPDLNKPVEPPAPVEAPVNDQPRQLHVSVTGHDENDGSATAPFRTIQRAAEQAQPGETVLVHTGVYPGFHTVRGGQPDQPITFRAEGEVRIVPRAEMPAKERHRLDNIVIDSCDHVVIEGFRVQAATRAGISIIDSRHVAIRENIVGPNGRWGIFTGFAPEVQIISNVTFGSAGEHGIYVSNSRVPDDKPVIAYNHSYSNHVNGIQLNGDCMVGGDGSLDGALLEGNVVHDNGAKGLSLISMSSSVVQNNLIYNNGLRMGAGGIHLTDELGCGRPSSTNVVVNNTVVEPRIACIRITDGAHENILFNNLLIGPRPLVDEAGGNHVDEDSNVLTDTEAGVFFNPEAGDYRPLRNSLPSNRGVPRYRDRLAPLHDATGARRKAALGVDAGAF